MKIHTIDGKIINTASLHLLSQRGSEVIVYNDDINVYKIFKDNYKLGHKSIEELNYLSSIKTSRILMPNDLLFNNKNLIGYTMPYIKESKNIRNDYMNNLLNELMILKQDIKVLNESKIRLIDINKSNIVYNGKLYLVDPGNYYINDIDDLLIYFQGNKITKEDKKQIIEKWNYEKINKLIYELLFMQNSDIDFYLLRKIIEFFNNERIKENLVFDDNIYKKYFDSNMTIKESINKFVSNYIKIDEDEKKMILSLFKEK